MRKKPATEEVEIDLMDLVAELKRHAAMIAGSTMFCLALASGYAFFVQQANYEAIALIRLPLDVEEMQVNTCVEILKADQEEGLSLKEVEQLPESYVLSLVFRDVSKEKVTEDLHNYLPLATQKLNRILLEKPEADFQRHLLDTIGQDVAALAVQTEASPKEVERRLAYIQAKVADMEANKTFAMAEPLSTAPQVAEVPPNRQGSLLLGLLCGAFFSCAYVLCRSLFRRFDS